MVQPNHGIFGIVIAETIASHSHQTIILAKTINYRTISDFPTIVLTLVNINVIIVVVAFVIFSRLQHLMKSIPCLCAQCFVHSGSQAVGLQFFEVMICHKKPKHSKAQSTMPTSRDVRDKP